MTKTKKDASLFTIVSTHWLTSSIAMPFLLTLIVIFAFATLNPNILEVSSFEHNKVYFLAQFIASTLGMYLGVLYSKSYIYKTYNFNQEHKLIKYSLYWAIFIIVSNIAVFISQLGYTSFALLLSVVFAVLNAGIFYLTTKKVFTKKSEN